VGVLSFLVELVFFVGWGVLFGIFSRGFGSMWFIYAWVLLL
jgi:hypothetical protein